jgi:hypothetical protein
MKATTLLVAGSLAVAPAAPATAADFSRVDLRPYLLVSAHLVIANIFEPTELTYEAQQQFISQGGATFSALSIQVAQQAPAAQVYRGVATPAQLDGLRSKLNSAKVGVQRSCEIRSTGGRVGYFDFTWHSVRGRRNAFRVVLSSAGDSGLPPCREAVIQLLADLRNFEFDLLANPDTEILQTPH